MQQDTIFSNDILSHPLAPQVVAICERVGDDIISDLVHAEVDGERPAEARQAAARP